MNHRVIHHLIAPSVLGAPIACGQSYEAAETFVRAELGPRAVISLHVTRRENSEGRRYLVPCPVCEDAARFWDAAPKSPQNGAQQKRQEAMRASICDLYGLAGAP